MTFVLFITLYWYCIVAINILVCIVYNDIVISSIVIGHEDFQLNIPFDVQAICIIGLHCTIHLYQHYINITIIVIIINIESKYCSGFVLITIVWIWSQNSCLYWIQQVSRYSIESIFQQVSRYSFQYPFGDHSNHHYQYSWHPLFIQRFIIDYIVLISYIGIVIIVINIVHICYWLPTKVNRESVMLLIMFDQIFLLS